MLPPLPRNRHARLLIAVCVAALGVHALVAAARLQRWLLSAAGTAYSTAAAPQHAQKGPPSILLVLADQWRASALSAARPGRDATYPLTPRLDAFAAGPGGVRFERAYATNPVCTPSRASLLTGRWSHETGVTAVNLMLPRAERTLAEALRDSPANYSTHYIGKLHIDGDAKPGLVRKGTWHRRGFEGFEGFNRGHLYVLVPAAVAAALRSASAATPLLLLLRAAPFPPLSP